MLINSGAYDLPAIVGKNDHHVDQPKRRRQHNEHTDRSDALGLIPQEGPPILRSRAFEYHSPTGPSHWIRFSVLTTMLEVLSPGVSRQKTNRPFTRSLIDRTAS